MEWYTERQLQEISLGGLLILVVIRTIQYNMLKMRDKYLHTNCLAALANMSSQFKNLHPYVSQRIVSMFEALARKHSRLVATLQQSGTTAAGDADGETFPHFGPRTSFSNFQKSCLPLVFPYFGPQGNYLNFQKRITLFSHISYSKGKYLNLKNESFCFLVPFGSSGETFDFFKKKCLVKGTTRTPR